MLILAVDDDPHLRKLYEEEFQEEGYDVLVASSGPEALDIFSKESPDIVTLDIIMPGMDGIEVLRKMKEHNPSVPVIMSTGYSCKDDFAVWASDAYIIKNIDLTELKCAIDKLLVTFKR